MIRAIALGAVLFLIAPAALAQNDHDALCDPWQPIIHGTDGGDTDSAGFRGVCYDGLGGNDTFTGGSGPDNVLGSAGDDTLSGGPASNGDDLHGGGGNDTIQGRSGDDIGYGGTGDDTLVGQGGSDALFGGGFCHETGYYGFDFGPADPANLADVPCGTGGSDHLSGGDGRDFLWESNSDHVSDGIPDTLDGGPGNDYCAVGPEDTYTGCETVVVLSPQPPTRCAPRSTSCRSRLRFAEGGISWSGLGEQEVTSWDAKALAHAAISRCPRWPRASDTRWLVRLAGASCVAPTRTRVAVPTATRNPKSWTPAEAAEAALGPSPPSPRQFGTRGPGAFFVVDRSNPMTDQPTTQEQESGHD